MTNPMQTQCSHCVGLNIYRHNGAIVWRFDAQNILCFSMVSQVTVQPLWWLWVDLTHTSINNPHNLSSDDCVKDNLRLHWPKPEAASQDVFFYQDGLLFLSLYDNHGALFQSLWLSAGGLLGRTRPEICINSHCNNCVLCIDGHSWPCG